MKITYDYTINPHGNDPLVDLADEAVAQFALATIPGVWLVDIMPFCELNIPFKSWNQTD